ncbi:MAG: class I SAM-dependent methyltransferase [Gemmatimonadales bacterium]|nr:class I SAM-dependent methyltransferase [Gemmatimonadales bacterium]
MDSEVVGGSFRDPSGFLYTRNGTLYRQVNRVFQDRLAAFVGSGLYDELARDRLLIPHRPVGLELAATAEACAVLQPERVGFISYPYEWPFGWLRDAALLTLELQERALTRDFTLRDASAYNVQLHEGRLIFIDTLSFEPRVEGAPWAAYGQFCEHFLVPLALMSMRDIRCGSLLRSHIDGIPLDLGSRLLPASTWIRPGTALHVHLHAWAQSRYAQGDSRRASRKRAVSRQAALGLVKNLRSIIERLTWTPAGTEWADYTLDNNYSQAASASKREIVTGLLGGAGPQVVWDLGANTGEYSRAARELALRVISFDVDPAAVERNYRRVRAEGESGIVPLLLDLANPSPAQGWAHDERLSLESRGPADALLALALVHHLAIGHNLPLERIASFLSRLGRSLLIEFVPKSDSQVQRLLQSRPDIFPGYSREGFEAAFRRHFRIEAARPVAESERTLYLMTSCAAGRA